MSSGDNYSEKLGAMTIKCTLSHTILLVNVIITHNYNKPHDSRQHNCSTALQLHETKKKKA